MRFISAGAFSRCLLIVLLMLLGAACSRESPGAPDAQPVAGLTVVSLEGQAEWQADANEAWQTVAVGQKLPDGSRLRARGEQASVVTLEDQRVIRLQPGAVVSLDIIGEEMELLLGQARWIWRPRASIWDSACDWEKRKTRCCCAGVESGSCDWRAAAGCASRPTRRRSAALPW